MTDGPIDIKMPGGARVVSVGNQRGVPALWAEVDIDVARGGVYAKEPYIVTRRFYIVPTGGDVPAECLIALPGYEWGTGYRGTILFAEGALVFHVYETGDVQGAAA
jgi:hypothetical protein